MVAALAALCLAVIAIVAVMLTGRSTEPSETTVTQRGADGDFGWLETAMKQCDEQAAKEPKGLHYLVIPLVDEPRDEAGWRRISASL